MLFKLKLLLNATTPFHSIYTHNDSLIIYQTTFSMAEQINRITALVMSFFFCIRNIGQTSENIIQFIVESYFLVHSFRHLFQLLFQ